MVTIGEENFLDIGAREALLDRVMGEARFDKPSELLRRGRMPAHGLALVAHDDGQAGTRLVARDGEALFGGVAAQPAGRLVGQRSVGQRLVGTVRLWHVEAGEDFAGTGIPALLLGPLAVEASQQGRGTGTALMRAAIARAKADGHGAILLVGDPEYYARFGFTAGLTTGLVMPKPVDRRRFLALELQPAALRGARGLVAGTGLLVPWIAEGAPHRLAA
jgi:predicted N-acetyltransferase YhbS